MSVHTPSCYTPKAARQPRLLVYLDAPVEVLPQRIATRGGPRIVNRES